jgi:hypothetical protein
MRAIGERFRISVLGPTPFRSHLCVVAHHIAMRRREMSTYLINHLRIPGGIPNEEGVSYLILFARQIRMAQDRRP